MAGDMDTRYEGDKSTTVHNTARTVTTAPDANGFNFRPLASNTYGYHPKSVTTRCNPGAGLSAIAGLQAERDAEKAAKEPPAYLQNNRPGSLLTTFYQPPPSQSLNLHVSSYYWNLLQVPFMRLQPEPSYWGSY